MNQKKKPIANMSLDLDDLWSYMKVHGDEDWDKFPSYLDKVVPFVLDLFDELDIKITFFIVGQDAVFSKNHPILKSIIERGHEIGNHSFHHESWLKTYSSEKIEQEIIRAEESIVQATGYRTRCFRGPGFSWSNDLLEVLQKRDYVFDASILPTYISPIMRLYYFWNSKLTKEERNSRKELFGSCKEGFYSLKPFKLRLNNNKTLLEIPVTTIPILKIPFHLSYLIFISGYSMFAMKAYLNFSLFMCRITNTPPSVLLHPLDFISGNEVPQLKFFPGMNMTTEKKMKVVVYTLNKLKNKFDVQPMLRFTQNYLEQKAQLKETQLSK